MREENSRSLTRKNRGLGMTGLGGLDGMVAKVV
jgi:hypothetical protein